MLAAERQAMIVELIKENGSVQVDELAKEIECKFHDNSERSDEVGKR